MKIKKLTVLLLALAMVLGLFAGCGSTEQVATPTPEETAPETAPELTPETDPEVAPEEEEPSLYPVAGDVELSYFYMLDPSYGFGPDDMTMFQQMEAATGIHIDFTYSYGAEYRTQLNVMVAGGEMTDMIRNVANMFTEGVDWAVEEGILVAMNDYLEDYMPDYYRTITENPNYWNSIATSSGTIGAANGLYYEEFGPQYGFVIRQDWLDEVGKDIPETIDQWHDVLVAFKNEIGCEYPLWLSSVGAYTGDLFGTAYDTATQVNTGKYPMFQVDGAVHFGPLEPGYKEYVQLMVNWYNEGLISPDFAAGGSSGQAYMFPLPPGDAATGKYGIWCTMVGMFDQYKGLSDDENFQIVPLTDPVLTKGQTTHLGFDVDYVCQGSVGITTNCENIEAACMWLNYGYTEEGILLMNYGVEGEGFEYVDGEPVITELITNNPDGLTATGALFRYAGGDNSPTVINFRTSWVSYSDGAKSAMEIWGSVSDGAYELPKNCILTGEEAVEFNALYADIETYIMESILRFITGEMDMSQYDTFVETIQGMEIDRCIELYQQALDRALAA